MTEPVSSSCSLLAKLDEDLAKLGRVGKTGNAPDLKLSFSNISDESTTKYPRPAKAPRLSDDRHTMANLRGDMSILQHRLETEEVSRRRSLIAHEEEIKSLHLRNQRLEEETHEKRSQLQLCMSNLSSIRQQLDLCEQQLTYVQNGADEKLFKLAKANIEREKSLMEKIDNLTAELGRVKCDLLQERQDHSSSEQKLTINSRLLEAKSNEVESYKKFIEEKEEELSKMNALKQKIEGLEETIAKNKEADALVNAMRSKLDKFPTLEAENIRLTEENLKLRDREANNLLLRDENLSMRRKLDNMQQTQTALAAAEVEMERLKERLKRWEEFERSDPEGGSGRSVFRSPDELHRHLRELQRDNLRLSESRGRLQTATRQLETRRDQLERELATLRQRARDSEERLVTGEAELRRLRQRFNLVSQERDLTRRLLNEYEEEATCAISKDELDRVSALNDLLESYKSQIAEQDRTIQSLRRLDARTPQKADAPKVVDPVAESVVSQASEKLMAELRERIAELEDKLGKVTEEKEILEARIEQRNIQGDFDPTRTKVLHLVTNPASDSAQRRAAEVGRLREENERLRERVRVLEEMEAGPGAADVTGIVEQRLQEPNVPLAAQKEVEELKAKLSSEARKAERLIEVFKERSRQLREACFHLLGHRLDIKAGGEVKLTSAMAESQDEFLLFRVEESDTEPGTSASGKQRWMLMETEFSRTLEKDIEHYITTFNSIPAMVCSVFLENFGRQTMTE